MAELAESFSLLNSDAVSNATVVPAKRLSYPYVDRKTVRSRVRSAAQDNEPIQQIQQESHDDDDSDIEEEERVSQVENEQQKRHETDIEQVNDIQEDDTDDDEQGGAAAQTEQDGTQEETQAGAQAGAQDEQAPSVIDPSRAADAASSTPTYLKVAKITLGLIVLLAFAYVVHWISVNVFHYNFSQTLWQKLCDLYTSLLDRIGGLFGSSADKISPVPTAAAVVAAAALSSSSNSQNVPAQAEEAAKEAEASEPPAEPPAEQSTLAAAEPPAEQSTLAAAEPPAEPTAKPEPAVKLHITPLEAGGAQQKSEVSETVVASVQKLLSDITAAN